MGNYIIHQSTSPLNYIGVVNLLTHVISSTWVHINIPSASLMVFYTSSWIFSNIMLVMPMNFVSHSEMCFQRVIRDLSVAPYEHYFTLDFRSSRIHRRRRIFEIKSTELRLVCYSLLTCIWKTRKQSVKWIL